MEENSVEEQDRMDVSSDFFDDLARSFYASLSSPVFLHELSEIFGDSLDIEAGSSDLTEQERAAANSQTITTECIANELEGITLDSRMDESIPDNIQPEENSPVTQEASSSVSYCLNVERENSCTIEGFEFVMTPPPSDNATGSNCNSGNTTQDRENCDQTQANGKESDRRNGITTQDGKYCTSTQLDGNESGLSNEDTTQDNRNGSGSSNRSTMQDGKNCDLTHLNGNESGNGNTKEENIALTHEAIISSLSYCLSLEQETSCTIEGFEFVMTPPPQDNATGSNLNNRNIMSQDGENCDPIQANRKESDRMNGNTTQDEDENLDNRKGPSNGSMTQDGKNRDLTQLSGNGNTKKDKVTVDASPIRTCDGYHSSDFEIHDEEEIENSQSVIYYPKLQTALERYKRNHTRKIAGTSKSKRIDTRFGKRKSKRANESSFSDTDDSNNNTSLTGNKENSIELAGPEITRKKRKRSKNLKESQIGQLVFNTMAILNYENSQSEMSLENLSPTVSQESGNIETSQESVSKDKIYTDLDGSKRDENAKKIDNNNIVTGERTAEVGSEIENENASKNVEQNTANKEVNSNKIRSPISSLQKSNSALRRVSLCLTPKRRRVHFENRSNDENVPKCGENCPKMVGPLPTGSRNVDKSVLGLYQRRLQMANPLRRVTRGMMNVEFENKTVGSARLNMNIDLLRDPALDGQEYPAHSDEEDSEGEAQRHILVARTTDGHFVGIKLFRERPAAGDGGDAAHSAWFREHIKTVLQLKQDIEEAKVKVKDVEDQLVLDLKTYLSDEEKTNMDRQWELEEKKYKMAFLTTEFSLIEQDGRIKGCINLEGADTELCLKLLDELLEMDIKPLMLLKHPSSLETIKRLRCYVGNIESWKLTPEAEAEFKTKAHSIRSKAEKVFNKLKELFQTPEHLSFWEYFSQRVMHFKLCTADLSVDQVYCMVREPAGMLEMPSLSPIEPTEQKEQSNDTEPVPAKKSKANDKSEKTLKRQSSKKDENAVKKNGRKEDTEIENKKDKQNEIDKDDEEDKEVQKDKNAEKDMEVEKDKNVAAEDKQVVNDEEAEKDKEVREDKEIKKDKEEENDKGTTKEDENDIEDRDKETENGNEDKKDKQDKKEKEDMKDKDDKKDKQDKIEKEDKKDKQDKKDKEDKKGKQDTIDKEDKKEKEDKKDEEVVGKTRTRESAKKTNPAPRTPTKRKSKS